MKKSLIVFFRLEEGLYPISIWFFLLAYDIFSLITNRSRVQQVKPRSPKLV